MTGVLRGKGVVAISGSGPTGCCIMKPEILAPGTNIVSLDHHGALYSRKSGTSMATPVCSGATGTCLTEKPKLRPEELKLKLYESARKETGMSMAWGVLDVVICWHWYKILSKSLSVTFYENQRRRQMKRILNKLFSKLVLGGLIIILQFSWFVYLLYSATVYSSMVDALFKIATIVLAFVCLQQGYAFHI